MKKETPPFAEKTIRGVPLLSRKSSGPLSSHPVSPLREIVCFSRVLIDPGKPCPEVRRFGYR